MITTLSEGIVEGFSFGLVGMPLHAKIKPKCKISNAYSGFLDKSGTVSWGRPHITTDCRFINEYTKVLIRSIFCGSYARSLCNLVVHSRAVQMILFVYLHMNLCALAYEPQLVASGSYRNYICAVLMQETTVSQKRKSRRPKL